jgi:hypothetical protein
MGPLLGRALEFQYLSFHRRFVSQFVTVEKSPLHSLTCAIAGQELIPRRSLLELRYGDNLVRFLGALLTVQRNRPD